MGAEPTPEIAARVADLEARWPDNEDDSSWASMLIRGDARGPLLYLALRYGRPVEEVAFMVAAARARGLVCYDPRFSQLL
jgi:hypothetical protein